MRPGPRLNIEKIGDGAVSLLCDNNGRAHLRAKQEAETESLGTRGKDVERLPAIDLIRPESKPVAPPAL
ncbi:MAG TPA: hypothetical protein VKH45_10510 [Candidatus Acidoferrum sp.]|nr:hypothetical protein [Candidatus Acidoferrum sp.]